MFWFFDFNRLSAILSFDNSFPSWQNCEFPINKNWIPSKKNPDRLRGSSFMYFRVLKILPIPLKGIDRQGFGSSTSKDKNTGLELTGKNHLTRINRLDSWASIEGLGSMDQNRQTGIEGPKLTGWNRWAEIDSLKLMKLESRGRNSPFILKALLIKNCSRESSSWQSGCQLHCRIKNSNLWSYNYRLIWVRIYRSSLGLAASWPGQPVMKSSWRIESMNSVETELQLDRGWGRRWDHPGQEDLLPWESAKKMEFIVSCWPWAPYPGQSYPIR